jgi:hypothetical protein
MRAKEGDYEAPFKPQLYDFTKDSNSAENKKKISKALDCFEKEDIELIDFNKHAFDDECFGILSS